MKKFLKSILKYTTYTLLSIIGFIGVLSLSYYIGFQIGEHYKTEMLHFSSDLIVYTLHLLV